MYRHILVPLDGSKRAEIVIPHIIEFARVRNARTLLLRVIEPLRIEAIVAGPVVAASVPARAILGDAQEQVKAEAEAYLKHLRARLESKGIDCLASVEQGEIVQCIARSAERFDVDLIIMTSRGRTASASAFHGSVALGVLHRTDRPILLIHRHSRQGREPIICSMNRKLFLTTPATVQGKRLVAAGRFSLVELRQVANPSWRTCILTKNRTAGATLGVDHAKRHASRRWSLWGFVMGVLFIAGLLWPLLVGNPRETTSILTTPGTPLDSCWRTLRGSNSKAVPLSVDTRMCDLARESEKREKNDPISDW